MTMVKMKARFAAKCEDTGLYIARGEDMYYDRATKKCYGAKSETFKKLEEALAKRSNDIVPDPGEISADQWAQQNL